MALNKLADGHWRTSDGAYEVIEYDGSFLVNELQRNRYVTVATAKNYTEAQREVTRLVKAQDSEPEVEEGTIVVDAPEHQKAAAEAVAETDGDE